MASLVISVVLALLACGRGPLFYRCGRQIPAVCGAVSAPADEPSAIALRDGSGLDECSPTFACFVLGDRNHFARCNPRQVPVIAPDFMCCSDDPAAPSDALPDFEGRGIDGDEPYFAGDNNPLGTSGILVRTDGVDDGLLEDLAEGCPVPCNPTWPAPDIVTVCGVGQVCCQTSPLQAADCVRDPATGQFRPVTGDDIGSLTDWNPGAHTTHQDPAGVACTGHAQGDQSSDVFLECIVELTVANQRGICMDADDCHVDPDHRTACDALND